METMIGMFINTVPVRVRVPPDMVSRNGCRSYRLNKQKPGATSTTRSQKSSGGQHTAWPPDVRERSYLCELILLRPPLKKQEVKLRVSEIHFHERTDLPLTMQAAPGPELHFRVLYDKQRIDDESAVRVLGHLKTILVALSEGLDGRVGDVPILTAQEREDCWCEHPDRLEMTVQATFEASVAG